MLCRFSHKRGWKCYQASHLIPESSSKASLGKGKNGLLLLPHSSWGWDELHALIPWLLSLWWKDSTLNPRVITWRINQVRFHLSRCQDAVSRAWAADEMLTVLTWREESELQPRASAFWYNDGGHWTGRRRASPAERSGAVTRSARSQACARSGSGGVPSTFHRGPYTGGIWPLFHVPSLSCSNRTLGIQAWNLTPFQDLNRHLQIELGPKGQPTGPISGARDPNGGRIHLGNVLIGLTLILIC